MDTALLQTLTTVSTIVGLQLASEYSALHDLVI